MQNQNLPSWIYSIIDKIYLHSGSWVNVWTHPVCLFHDSEANGPEIGRVLLDCLPPTDIVFDPRDFHHNSGQCTKRDHQDIF
jgi:hypothetical protein